MRTIILIYFNLILSLASFAQISYKLEIERTVKDSTLHLDLFIQNSNSKPFVLGGSNFLVDLKSPGLDIKNAKFFPGEFDKSSHLAYSNMGTGTENLLVMNVRADVGNSTSGKNVTEQRSKIGSIDIPITDPCKSAKPVWFKDGAVQSYSKGAKAEDITKGANYINPEPIDLDGGVSKTIPSIDSKNGKLNSSSKSNNQWFLDDVAIPGAIKQEFIPQIEGNYTVLVSYPCAKNFSESVPIFITGLKEFALSYNFVSLPNPFIGECKIKYSLPNTANTKLQVYDISGTHLIDLETGQSLDDPSVQLKTYAVRIEAEQVLIEVK